MAVNRWQQVGEQIFSEELDKGYQKAFLRQAQAFIESEEFEKYLSPHFIFNISKIVGAGGGTTFLL